MFIHQPLGAFDLTGQVGKFLPANADAGLPLDVFVIGAKDPTTVMGEYAKITGHPEMAPLWAFGYQQSHRTLGKPEETLQETKYLSREEASLRRDDLSGNGLLSERLEHSQRRVHLEFEGFPGSPRSLIRMLRDEHFKVTLHVVIEGKRVAGAVTDACTAAPLPTGRTADNNWPPGSPGEVATGRRISHWSIWVWMAGGPIREMGLDPASRLARNRMYFEGQQMYRPNERVYALHRNAYAGTQRYASFLWSGDVQSRWETLKNHVAIAVNTGLSGIPYWGSDIGGFVPTQEYTGEMYLRWFQFAAFNPLFRSHGREWRLHTPIGWTAGEIIGFRETPNYNPDPRELNNPAVEPICRKYLELRYQLIPYLYSAVKETCETGLPIVRALWLHYPQDSAAVARGDEYLFGRDILVAPVVEKGARLRSVYLPRGAWYDFWTKEKMEGAREISCKVDLETIPLYVRAGAIIPMGPVKQYTEEKVEGPLTLWVPPGADGAFSLYEDDGNTFDFRKGVFMRLNMVWNDQQRRLSLRLGNGSKMLAPMKRNIVVRLAGSQQTKDVVFDGRPVEVRF